MDIMKFDKIVSGLLFLLILISTSSQSAKAECYLEDDHYHCEGGSINDLKKVAGNIKNLMINFMRIESLTSNIMSRFKELEYLTITNCHVSSLDNNTFSNNKKLKTINLFNNLIRKLQTNAFQGLDSLIKLDVGYNHIYCIEKDLFNKTLPNLEELNLEHNRLGCFNFNALQNQKNLLKIDIQDNVDFKCLDALKKYTNGRKIKLTYSTIMNNTEDLTWPALCS